MNDIILGKIKNKRAVKLNYSFDEDIQSSYEDLQFKQAIALFTAVRGLCCQKLDVAATHKLKLHRWHVKIC